MIQYRTMDEFIAAGILPDLREPLKNIFRDHNGDGLILYRNGTVESKCSEARIVVFGPQSKIKSISEVPSLESAASHALSPFGWIARNDAEKD